MSISRDSQFRFPISSSAEVSKLFFGFWVVHRKRQAELAKSPTLDNFLFHLFIVLPLVDLGIKKADSIEASHFTIHKLALLKSQSSSLRLFFASPYFLHSMNLLHIHF